MSTDKPYWWEEDPQERFWMEVVARPEFGDRLLAPYNRGRDGKDMPFHATVDKVRDGEIVLHWVTDKHPAGPAFIGYSIVDGFPFPIGAADYEDAEPLPGRAALLRDFTEFPVTITRSVLYDRRAEVFALIASLRRTVEAQKRSVRQALLFPFDQRSNGQDIRAHQGGYLSKFPAALFEILPELRPAQGAVAAKSEFAVTAEKRTLPAVETRIDRRRAREAGDIGDASFRRAVELQALRQAKSFFEAAGNLVTDVGSSRSYDLLLAPPEGGPERHVIVRGSTGRIRDIDLSSAAVDDVHSAPTDLILVHDIPCERSGTEFTTSEGTLRARLGWRPPISSLVPIQFRHTLG